MTISAKITLSDSSILIRLFDSFYDLDAWMSRHKAHVSAVEARTVQTRELRQGRYA